MTTISNPAEGVETAPAAEPVILEREGSGLFNGVSVRYRAIASETYLRDESGKPIASFFTVAYVKSEHDGGDRPITFLFNGGPGSSAQWLHMGAFGPKRVEFPRDPCSALAPPYSIIDNSSCILDVTDLVFVDPIGTGYSRTLSGKEPKDYWGVMEDARSVADFIQTWITEQQRWNSPKYIVGESYGTTRACLIAELLGQRGIALNGIVWVSGVSDYQHIRPRAGDNGLMAYVSFLPTLAATAWYHGKVQRGSHTFEQFLDEVRAFSRTKYVQALVAGHRLPESDRAYVLSRMASYTGLSEQYIEQCNLRIVVGRFFKELLRDKAVVIGRLDSRFMGMEAESVGELPESDPSIDAIVGALTTSMNVQLSELGVRMQRPYISMSEKASECWNWRLEEKTPNGGGYLNVLPNLGRAMRRNGDLRVLAICGYYDLAAPFFAVENSLSSAGLVQERIAYSYYEVGHMVFLHEPSREKLLQDVRKFIGKGSRVPSQHASTPIGS